MSLIDFPGEPHHIRERREVLEPRIRLVPFEEVKLQTERRHLIKGLIPATELVVVWGPPKCGKSFWITDAMLHSALGWEYRGRRVRQGPVVYCAMEGAAGYGARLAAFRQRYLTEDHEHIPFYLVPVPMTLVRDRDALIAAIRLRLADKKPAAIVLDTLNRSIGGSESDDRDMAAYIAAADALWSEFNCAIIVVHHCGVDGSRPRGHTSLTGAADAQLAVKRDQTGNVIVTVEWMKDGPEGETIVSRLEQVEVGSDEDGEPITSCVVEPANDTQPSASSRWPKGLVFYHRSLLAALDSFGQDTLPFADGPRVRAVNREHVRAEFKRIYPVDGDTEAKKDDALRKAFKRAESDAITRNLIVCREVGDAMRVWAVVP